MVAYIVIILIAMVTIAAFNLIVATPASLLGLGGVLLAVTVSTVAVIALDGLEAFLIRRLPEKWFARGKKYFAVSRRECRLWCALGVRRWREKVPELGQFSGFRKDKVYEPQNNAYVARYLMECNYGVVIHLVNALTGFLIVFLYPLRIAPCIGIPVAVVNAILSLLPLMALRYNTPKLESLYALNERREAKRNASPSP
jgi:hypothetical protein